MNKLILDIPEELKTWLKKYCFDNNETIKSLVTNLIIKFKEKH